MKNHTSNTVPIPDGYKRCSKRENCLHPHGPLLPATLEYFYKNSREKGGLHHYCKYCAAKSQGKTYSRRKKQKPATKEGFKICAKCNTELPATLEYFRADKTGKYGVHSICHNCKCYADRKYRKTPEAQAIRQTIEVLERNRKRDNNRYRTPKRQNSLQRSKQRRYIDLPNAFDNSDWKHALGYFNGCCAACDRPPGFWHTLAADHWIPISSLDCPGTIPTNIVPLCHGQGGCNNSKLNRDPVKWLKQKFGANRANEILARVEAYFEWVRSLEDAP